MRRVAAYLALFDICAVVGLLVSATVATVSGTGPFIGWSAVLRLSAVVLVLAVPALVLATRSPGRPGLALVLALAPPILVVALMTWRYA